jgi:hypothetical protein
MTTGTIEHQLKNVIKDREKCFVRDFQTTSNEFRQLIFDDYMGVFAILLSGCAFSFLFLITELLTRYKKFDFFILIDRKILALRIEVIL